MNKLLTFFFIFFAVGSEVCLGFNEITIYAIDTTNQPIHLNPISKMKQAKKYLKNKTIDGMLESRNIVIYYENNLKSQAMGVQKSLLHAFDHIREITGIELKAKKISIYLVREETPSFMSIMPPTTYGKYTEEIISQLGISPFFYEKGKRYDFSFILFVFPNRERCEDILAENQYLPLFIHEMVEYSLGDHQEGIPFFSSAKWQDRTGIFNDVSKQTRWFIDGLSDYSTYLFFQDIWLELSHKEQQIPLFWQQQPTARTPFISLEKCGKNIFNWSFKDPIRRESIVYYNAAFGLCLLLQEKFGEDAIKRIYLNLACKNNIDGDVLIKTINDTFNTNIEQIIEKFSLPKIGISLSSNINTDINGKLVSEYLVIKEVKNGSIADQAGIKKNDVLHLINNVPIKTLFDFEMAIFKGMDRQNIEITILRDKTEFVTNINLIKKENGK